MKIDAIADVEASSARSTKPLLTLIVDADAPNSTQPRLRLHGTLIVPLARVVKTESVLCNGGVDLTHAIIFPTFRYLDHIQRPSLLQRRKMPICEGSILHFLSLAIGRILL